MKNQNPILSSLASSIAVFIYASGVAWILFNGQRIFGKVTSFWGPLALLLLFIVSALVTGSLVLGRPILLYLEGKKPDAVRLFFYTLGWLALITIAIFLTHPWK